MLLIMAGEVLTSAPKMIFEENKNQWPEQVMFEADFGGGKLFLEKNTFTYLFIENVNFHDITRDENIPPLVHYHSFKVNFLNSNATVGLTGNAPFSFHRNYFLGNNPQNWAEGVKLYGEVMYENLYSSIDMKVYNVDQNLKYDLIVKPGGDPKVIKFDYEGTDKMHLENGHLYIQTSVGMVIEQKPFAYQVIDGVKKEISCSYELKKHTLSFSINEKYNKNYPLVIDPVLIASTYTGSYADNWGFTATYDDAGNIYTAGIAASAGYPTTIGAWDNTFNGGMPWTWTTYPYDISITKYNATGTTILFSTYYGGSQNEQPHSLFVNSNNELFLTGRTNSPNFPTTVSAYDVSYNGGYDIIVGKFNSSGALLASTFLGGTGDDGVNMYSAENAFGSLKFNYADDGRGEIILDNNSNVYVAGSTRSTNFPTSSGAYDNTLGGAQDGCVFKMNSTLTTLLFSTYLGGSGNDAAYGLKLNSGNDLYVTGGTASTNFPTTAGVLHSTFQGGVADGFITALNSTGTSVLYSTYIGTTAYDQAYLIETDANDDIYVYGQTKGAYPVTPGVYSNPNSGQFIHKLNKQLNTTLFSTVFGTGTPNPNISPTAFLVDSCQSIYIAGWGRCGYAFNNPSPSTVTGMPITANAYKSTTDGCDFYFMVLRPNAQALLYGTFFGENSPIGDHVDGGTSRFDKRGFIYQSVCASCGGYDNFPTTPTAWSRYNNSSNCNNAVIKMDLTVHPVASAVIVGSPYGCAPLTVPFNNTGSLGTNFTWNFGDGSPMVNIPSPTHTYSTVGTYTASLYVSDSTGTCGRVDTAKVIINVGGPPTLLTSPTAVFCSGGSNGTASVTATGGLSPYTYLWSASGGQTTATATGLSAGTYSVTVTNSFGCTAAASATVTQPSVLTITPTYTNVGCFGGSDGTATPTVSGGNAPFTYLWLPGGVTTSSVTGLSVNSYSVTVTDTKGCTASSSVSISEPPALSITSTITGASCGQSNGSATVSGTGGFAPYTWTWSGGQTGATVSGLGAGTFTVTIHDVNLCTASLPVSIANTSGPSATITSTNVSCNGANNGSATITTTGGTLPFTYLWNNGQTTPTASNLAAGIYSVIATDLQNCSATASITITEPPLLTANANGVNPTCFGFLNGSVTVSALDGSPPYTYLWTISGSPTTASVSGLGSGVYNATVTDFNGCIKLASVTLVDPDPVSTFISNTGVLCAGDCNGTATATATNGFPPYSFLWNDTAHQTSALATGLCATSFSVNITDAHGCPSSAATTIGSPMQLTSTMTVGNVSCFGLCDGFSQVSPLGGTPPYSYNWTTGTSITAGATGLCSGAFSCTITDANGCTTISADTIVQPDQLTGSVNVLKIPCNGLCDGSITTNYNGGVPPYNYLWLPGLQTQSNPTNLCAGNNSVTITDANGCNAGGTIVLTAPPPLTISSSTTSSVCGQANGGACVTAAGGTLAYKYLWNTSPTDTLDCVSGLLANTYSVTVTDGMGCTISTNENINDISGPLLTITLNTAVTCFGLSNGIANATVTGGIPPYSLFWTPGGQTIPNPTNLNAGVNTLTATDSLGCVVSASTTIGNHTEIVSAITGVQNLSCNGICDGSASVLYGGGVAPLSIVWDAPGNPTTSSINSLCAGRYNVTITDSSGCVRIDSSLIITQSDSIVILSSTVSNIKCFGNNNGIISTVIGGGTPFYTFTWLPNVSTSGTATNLGAGIYTLTITDYTGCSISQTETISSPVTLIVSSNSNPTSCNNSDGNASIIASGGTPSYTYQWNDINLQTTAMAQNLPVGNYVCTVTDTNNCNISDTVAVLSLPGPLIDSVIASPVLCFGGNTGTAKVILGSGTGSPPFNYLWLPSSQTTDTAIGLVHGVQSVLITDANGCVANGSVLITQPAVLSIMVSPADTVCYLDTAQVYAQALGGTPNYIYTWLGASGIGLSGSGPHLVLPPANTIYSVNVIDANGCSAGPMDMQVIIPPSLSVATTSDLQICDGNSGTLSATASGGNGGPYTYVWSNGSTGSSQIVSPSIAVSPISYFVTISDGCSQPTSDTAIVIVNANPTGVFSLSDTTGCEPLTVNFNASSNNNGASFSWDFGDSSTGIGASPSHTYLNDSIYTVTLTITSTTGCITLVGSTGVITVNPLPLANFSINTNPLSSFYTIADFTDLSVSQISSWLWDFGDFSSGSNSSSVQNPSHTFVDAGTYDVQLIVTNQYGCIDTTNSEITTYGNIIFPNVFTPNTDGAPGGSYSLFDLSNDVFFPHTYGVIEYKLYVFDRWGELIFESDDIKQGWDGYYRGKLCQQDVYVWKADIKLNNGKIYNLSGNVTLLR